ncbi:MAG TPA: hypothetical protein VNZ61_16175 [Roseomonas sp.]|nr:hypothetical protein [Roseomonas sp.]
MFHHRSCGTADLVALMAAHRAAQHAATALRQQEVTRTLRMLEEQEVPARPDSLPASGAAPISGR